MLLFNLILGCGEEPENGFEGKEATEVADKDGDQFRQDEDCDDNNADVNPIADEICDGIDNNCDGEIDENLTTTYFIDSDGDDFGVPDSATELCEINDGYALQEGDCDDNDALIHPDAEEICDYQDNNCDEQVDEGVVQIYFQDLDEDGYGGTPVESCGMSDGMVSVEGDCDDLDPSRNPSAEELCDNLDNDCDDLIDEELIVIQYQDLDGDGYGDPSTETTDCNLVGNNVAQGDDCDDLNPQINPGVSDICDGIDNNCNGIFDDNPPNGTPYFYPDVDQDGYGDENSGVQACSAPQGYTQSGTDCDDTNPLIVPGADEICDELDNDCNGHTDDLAVDGTPVYSDTDGDGFGDPLSEETTCSVTAIHVLTGDDCDDTNPEANPDAEEVCDDVDNDCDGLIDLVDPSLVGFIDYYVDSDGDGYGDPDGSTIEGCSSVDGYSSNADDCNDNNAESYPQADELCDGEDNNCDGQIDEGFPATSYYIDLDLDGYGNGGNPTDTVDGLPISFSSCVPPEGCPFDDPTTGEPLDCVYVTNPDDCNDENPLQLSLLSPEDCDNEDNNCNGMIDEGLSSDLFIDFDGDGYGDPNDNSNLSAGCDVPDGYSTEPTDCNDQDPNINPAVEEICDEIDNNCNNLVDDGVSLTWYEDIDGDGYGNSSQSETSCTQPEGFVDNSEDCLDGSQIQGAELINPEAEEICDGVDNNCDGLIDEGLIQEWYQDNDGDGFGMADDLGLAACEPPSAAYTLNLGDCDDSDPYTFYGAAEFEDAQLCTTDADEDGFGAMNGIDAGIDCNDNDGSNPQSDGSCAQAQTCLNINGASGTYIIDPDGAEFGLTPFSAYCDMDTTANGQTGGWTVVYSTTGSDNEEPITSDASISGNPLNFEHYNLTQAQKVAIAEQSSASLVLKDSGNWLHINTPLFDNSLLTPNSHASYPANIAASNGVADLDGWIGWSNFNIAGGGDFNISSTDGETCSGIFSNEGVDLHSADAYHLNCDCTRHYLYSYSDVDLDGDPRYDTFQTLGSWQGTETCISDEGSGISFSAGMR